MENRVHFREGLARELAARMKHVLGRALGANFLLRRWQPNARAQNARATHEPAVTHKYTVGFVDVVCAAATGPTQSSIDEVESVQ